MTAYSRGYEDFKSGRSVMENPYEITSDDYEDWDDGWHDSFDDEDAWIDDEDYDEDEI